jgi:hypothetical protein
MHMKLIHLPGIHPYSCDRYTVPVVAPTRVRVRCLCSTMIATYEGLHDVIVDHSFVSHHYTIVLTMGNNASHTNIKPHAAIEEKASASTSNDSSSTKSAAFHANLPRSSSMDLSSYCPVINKKDDGGSSVAASTIEKESSSSSCPVKYKNPNIYNVRAWTSSSSA